MKQDVMFLAYLRGIETLNIVYYLISKTRFLAYLRGIETGFRSTDKFLNFSEFLAYLRGIETDHSLF